MSVVATLDHVVVNARDGLDAAAETYRRLGFSLTPRGRHTLGTENHLAMFGTDYLELIAAPAARDDLPPLAWPLGLNALVFGTEDADATYAALTGFGASVHAPLAFSRPVDVPGSVRDASFRTVNFADGVWPGGRAYFCQHFSRDLVWRDEWRVHPNGVVGVDGVVIAARDPGGIGELFGRMFGGEAVAGIEGGVRLACGLTRIEVLVPSMASERLGEPVRLAVGQDSLMAGLLLRVSRLSRTAEALRQGGIASRDHAGGVVVAHALGTVLGFVE